MLSVNRRGIFLSLFSLMLGLGVMFTADCSSTTDRIKCFKKGVADLYSGRVASMAVVLSCSSIPPRRPGEEIWRAGGNPGGNLGGNLGGNPGENPGGNLGGNPGGKSMKTDLEP